MTPANESSFEATLEEALGGRTLVDRKLLFVGLLNARLPDGFRAVLVGGSVVEFYSEGQYTSADVDLIGNHRAISRVLLGAGFTARGRYFVHAGLDLLVEAPKDRLRPTETIVEFDFEGIRVPMVSKEDVIVDRLLATRFWKSRTDWEQAILVFAAHKDTLDRVALAKKAAANEVEDLIAELDRLTTR